MSESQGESQTQQTEHRRGPSKDELRAGFGKMRKLAWITIAHYVVAAAGISFLAGGSQVMKTQWIECLMSAVPAIGVLLTWKTENHQQDKNRPFGYHRAGTIAFVMAAFALAGIGTWLFFESALSLLHGERPAIGGFTVFGQTVWHGWLMIGALVVTSIPPFVLGRLKLPVAILLHDKPLFADADMNRASYLADGAGIVGIVLVGFGFWWGDAAAALLISLDIMHDGWKNVSKSLSDVMDHHPTDLETDRQDALVADIYREIKTLPWANDCHALVREHGRWIVAELFVTPGAGAPPATEATRQIREAVMPLDWRLTHLAVELTDDVKASSNVLTREEIDIEAD